MLRKSRMPLRLWHFLASLSLIVSLFAPLQSARARSVVPALANTEYAGTYSAPLPTGSPAIVASLTGAGAVGPDGVVSLMVTLNAGVGEALTALEASASGANGQWQTLATLSTPGPVTVSTGFNVTLPAFGGNGAAGEKMVYLRASDASGNRSTAALVVAYDPALPMFGDVPGNLPAEEAEAIRQMAARGIIKGYNDGNFGATDTTQRAQMAALIARAMGWSGEDWGNQFSDRGGLIESLWRNVGTLQHYQVAFGFDGAACAARNTASPCFGPTEPVTQAQTISFITRAMVKKGYWQGHAADANPFPNVPASSGHVADLATFVSYVGAPPGATAGSDWAAWSSAATRGWFAQAEWRVVRWLESSPNWATLPQPPFVHQLHGVATGANTTDKAPQGGDTVTIGAWLYADSNPVPGAAMATTASYAGGTVSCTGTSGGDGWAQCDLAITQAMAGQTVAVETTFTHQGATRSARVVLTVAGTVTPSPSPSPSPSPVGSLPPDPSTVAPPLAVGVATDFGSATEFLYTGDNPIQTGVQSGAIQREHATVLSGRVILRDGQPLPGVRITIKDHPEYGSTLSRADGKYDLAANGGGLVLDFRHDGFLPAQRRADAPWRDYTHVPDVALVPLSGQATVIDLNSTAPMQVARGEVQTDNAGSRRATLLFPQGTTASLTLPGSGTQPLNTLTVRATEYTVGSNGRAAMPGDLPPTSAYTYAVELSADEAIAAGAREIRFSQPVFSYVENFLGFPVGTAVPAGYYDRDLAAWIPGDNGRVIKVLAVDGGLADIDTDGDGAADGAAALAALGVTDAERAQLASLYAPGQTLWRTPIPHFTPWDYNWPYGPPDGATGPNQPSPTGGPGDGPDSGDGPGNDDGGGGDDGPSADDERTEEDDCEQGSIILCRDQILNEHLRITGTDLNLVYSSGRAPARNTTYSLDIPISSDQVPNGLKSIVLWTYIGGQSRYQHFTPAPNQNVRFEWDGRDWSGRPTTSALPISVWITYEYPTVYFPVRSDFNRSFAAFAAEGRVPGQAMLANRGQVSITQRWTGMLQRPRPESTAVIATIGGWTIDQHHQYDPSSGTLFLGDGTRRAIDTEDEVMPVLQASTTQLGQPWGVVVAADGTAYITDAGVHRVWRVTQSGDRTIVAGTGPAGFSGDGGAATAARLNEPKGIAIGPDGSLYIADTGNHRIRRIDPGGTITTVAGTGAAAFGGDGGAATAAALNAPNAVAVASDGTFYITDTMNNRVRRVDVSGVISTVVGGGNTLTLDGADGLAAKLYRPRGLAVDPSGRVYFINVEGVEDTGGRVLRLELDGTLRTVAGGGEHFADGRQAITIQLQFPQAVAIGPDGSVFIAESTRVRRVSTRGISVAAAGPGLGNGLLGQRAVAADLGTNVYGVAYGPDGYLYFAHNSAEAHVAKVGPAIAGFLPGETGIPSADGTQIYFFDAGGQHLTTTDAFTNAIIWQFGYDGLGRLASVDDGDGNVIQIEYSGNKPSAIIAPYGQRTELTVDANGWLATFTDPATQATRLATTWDGLLTSLVEPNNGVHTYTYTGQGYLTRDQDPDGRTKTLIRTDRADKRGHSVAVTSREGRVTVYGVERFDDGSVRRTKRYADNTVTTTVVDTYGNVRIEQPDGSVTRFVSLPDPRWGMLAPISNAAGEWTNGRTYSRTVERTVTLANPLDRRSLVSQVDVVTVNGKVTTTTYTAATRTIATVTPENRVMTVTLDERGRVVREQRAASLLATNFTYDNRGRLATVSQGTSAEQRTTTLAYGTDGLLASATDPLNRTTSYTRDPLGRITAITRPDSKVIGLRYDAEGNVTGLTPPGQPMHSQVYTAAGRGQSYEAPPLTGGGAVARTEVDRDRDGLITSVTTADGATVTTVRDDAGRTETITTPRGQVATSYDATTGLLTGLTAPGGVALSFAYDGTVRVGETWTGPVSGAVTSTMTADRQLASRAINGQSVAYQRDDDGRITQAGALAFALDPALGLPTAATLGGVTSTWGYNGFGEVNAIGTAFNGGALYHVGYTRDNLGRIAQKVETIGGVTATYDYAYDLADRLREVRMNGAVVEAYTYDDNGNRLTATTVGGSVNASYDTRDRLIAQGGTTYTYLANGELRTKSVGGQTTTYTYDPRGSLLSDTLPDGRAIEYVIDGQERRIGKRVDGALVQGFLYAGARLVAELDGNGNVVSTFVYTDGFIPAYMERGSVSYRLVTDQLGSVRLVVNAATGQVAQRLDYDTFGNVALDTNPGFQPFGFAGGLYDRDTGLVRYGARDYDPQAGRWTAKDPILFAGRQANLYAYVGNDPVNFIDMNGLSGSSSIVPSVISGPDSAGIAAGIGAWQAATTTVYYGLLIDIPAVAATAPVAAAPAATTAGAVFSSAIVGLWVGWRLDTAYTWASGDTLGHDLYDFFHPEMDEPAYDPQNQVCQ